MRDHKDGGTPGDFLWVPVRYTGIRTYNCSGVARGSLSNAQDHKLSLDDCTKTIQ